MPVGLANKPGRPRKLSESDLAKAVDLRTEKKFSYRQIRDAVDPDVSISTVYVAVRKVLSGTKKGGANSRAHSNERTNK